MTFSCTVDGPLGLPLVYREEILPPCDTCGLEQDLELVLKEIKGKDYLFCSLVSFAPTTLISNGSSSREMPGGLRSLEGGLGCWTEVGNCLC